MSEVLACDLCVIGAGAGGLAVAAGAAQMGARVVLIEKGEMGGECLNTGCVPSKALLAAGHAAQAARRAGRFGVLAPTVNVDANAVFAHVRAAITAIAPNDSQARFEGLGVTVLRAAARFTAADQVEAGETKVRAKAFVVATGSRPHLPPIEGLAALNPLTNESVFGLGAIPGHLLVIGGGAQGCELAQAFCGLGAEVTVLEVGALLGAFDADAAEVVRTRLLEDGVVLHEEAHILRAEGTADAPQLVVRSADGQEHVIAGTHILVAAGRRANVENLGLERAGVDFSPLGVEVDARLRSPGNARVFAVGDVAAIHGRAGAASTHGAAHHAGVALKNILFKWPARVRPEFLPAVVYTDPELAQAGEDEVRARARVGDNVRVLTWEFCDNDRAQAEGAAEGLVKVVTTKRGRVLGCAIAGAHAGELIQPWVLAMERGLKIGALAATAAPYPTLGEAGKRAAGAFFTPMLFGPRTRALVRFLLKFF